MRFIDNFLNKITMYRLLVYGLFIMVATAIGLSFFGLLPYSPQQLLLSLAILLATCHLSNLLFAWIFKAPKNIESTPITALILFFILAPARDLTQLYFILAAATIAMVAKYILAINKKHVFNPAAFASLTLVLSGSILPVWWVGAIAMLPITLTVGLLIVRKIRRFNLLFIFLVTWFITTVIFSIIKGFTVAEIIWQGIVSWPLIFFGTIMLTEPQTTPPGKIHQNIYAFLVGILFSAPYSFGPFYQTPELALLLGNIFSYFVSPKKKLILTLIKKEQLAGGIYQFYFKGKNYFNFTPGQYMEWTLPYDNPDNRGNRRYFTIASSPTRNEMELGIRFSGEESSEFKKALMQLPAGKKIIAGQLSGNFVLPKNKDTKLVFVAGGIGITPFKSMLEYLIDKKEKRDIIFIYSAATEQDFVYKNLLTEAQEKLGMQMIYLPTKPSDGWAGVSGYLTPKIIQEVIPEYTARTFYLSGPDAMVRNYKKMLRKLKISRVQIKTDYFPGF